MSDDDASHRFTAFEPAAIMRALGFLSRIPVPARFFAGAERPAAADAGAYPVAGLLVAAPGAVLLLIVEPAGASALLAASVAVLATIALTGALHEDGLADTADGFGGGADTERRLAIMKDSAIGAYGVIAVAASLLLRVVAIASLLDATSAVAAALAFMAAHALARAAMVWHWWQLPPARPDGVAAAAGRPARAARNLALGAALLVLLLAVAIPIGFGAAAIGALFVIGVGIGFARLSRRMIGGHTGDTIGACEQLSEAALLIGLAMAA